ncbi:MAG TPA: NAD(P)H-quinone oxidoreductase [Ktedonobacteraceae bacterium]|jgi:putative PIG3 family NAD(P)H quinone oxidoreductase
MRAVIISQPGGPEVLEIRDLAMPEPVADLVRVRVHAAGLNRADLAQRQGFYPAPAGFPADIPGLEFAGEVDAVGPNVRMWKPGQRVMGITGGGGQAEYLVLHEGMLVEIPDNLDYIQAAAIPEVFMTAHDALFTQGNLQMGERILIHAAGSGVGTAAIQLAHAIGATVFGTSRTPAKLEQAKPLGLDYGLSAQNFVDEVQGLVHDKGVHMILDFIGAAYMQQNLQLLTTRGRLVFLSTLGGVQANVDLRLVMSKRLQISGCTLRARSLEEKMAVTRRFATHVLPLLSKGAIKPIVERVYPLHEIAAAHTAMGENRNFGKLILNLDE